MEYRPVVPDSKVIQVPLVSYLSLSDYCMLLHQGVNVIHTCISWFSAICLNKYSRRLSDSSDPSSTIRLVNLNEK